MRRRTDVVSELFTHIDWDLAFVVYEYSDTVGHGFGLFTEEWDRVYRAIDLELGRLLEQVDDHTTVLLVSDHGWKRYPESFRLSAWLEREGFADWRANLPFSGRMVGVSRKVAPPGSLPLPLRPGDDLALAQIRAGLEAVRDPSMDRPLVSMIREPGEIFPGRFTDRAPGRLMVQLSDGNHPMLGEPKGPVFGGPVQHHSDEGIYLIAGPGIDAGHGREQSVYDIAPTVLEFFGIAPPDDAIGKALHSIPKRQNLEPIGALHFASPEPGERIGTKRLEEELKALGYVP
jgi:predicted AlkP superfamily phosphohydrolase/phosphomutase